MEFFQRFRRNAASQTQTRSTARPTNASMAEAAATRQLRVLPKSEREMVAMYSGDQVMWRHPQGYCFVVQVVAVLDDEVLVKLMRNGETRQLRVSPSTLSVTLAQARASVRRRASQQTRRLPPPTIQPASIAAGKTVRWHRQGAEPVMAHVLEVHWSDTAARICPVGQKLTCWVDMPLLEVVA